jgi:NDP-sugar pyrophosphorylase family protein
MYLLDRLAAAGLRDVVLLTGYRAEQVRAALGETYAGLRLHHAPEPEPLGTGGALRRVLGRLASPRVLVLNGDSLADVNLGALEDFHHERGAAGSLVLAWADDTARYGTVDVAPDGRITGFAEKRAGGAGWINAGVYLFERELIEAIPAGRFVSLERELFPQWADSGGLYGFCCRTSFLDIGTPESYAQAEVFVGVGRVA